MFNFIFWSVQPKRLAVEELQMSVLSMVKLHSKSSEIRAICFRMSCVQLQIISILFLNLEKKYLRKNNKNRFFLFWCSKKIRLLYCFVDSECKSLIIKERKIWKINNCIDKNWYSSQFSSEIDLNALYFCKACSTLSSR